MTRRVWRVSGHDDGCQVKRDGAARATRTFAKQQAAASAAKQLAQANAPSRVFVLRRDGTVKDFIDYGESTGLSYAGVFEGPDDLGTRSEKHLAEHFSQADAAS